MAKPARNTGSNDAIPNAIWLNSFGFIAAIPATIALAAATGKAKRWYKAPSTILKANIADAPTSKKARTHAAAYVEIHEVSVKFIYHSAYARQPTWVMHREFIQVNAKCKEEGGLASHKVQ